MREPIAKLLVSAVADTTSGTGSFVFASRAPNASRFETTKQPVPWVAVLLLLSLSACERHKPKPPRVPSGPVEWKPAEKQLPLPASATSVAIDVLRGTAADDVWAIASFSEARSSNRQLFHFDGAAWSLVPSPGRARTSLWPVAKNDVWAVGVMGVTAHWDGTSWSEHHKEGNYIDYLDVWVGADGIVWIAASGAYVIRFDGTEFKKVNPRELTRGGGSIQHLSSLGNELLLPAVSLSGAPAGIVHVTDAGFRFEQIGDGDGGLSLIAASAPDDLWALQYRGTATHFDGTKWAVLPTGTDLPLWAVAAVSKTEAWGVGDDGIIVRWDGTSWRESNSGTRAQLRSVFVAPGGGPLVGGDRLYELAR